MVKTAERSLEIYIIRRTKTHAYNTLYSSGDETNITTSFVITLQTTIDNHLLVINGYLIRGENQNHQLKKKPAKARNLGTE